ncbi:DUF1254 domain-containing protein [Paraburkholderia phymatum]|uniref:DUF1254 domain-containing protein n=1 Tax=Paraburkholderia phymatum TaxID=148447 RepID=A0ACC6U1Y4_9BURK
MNTTPKLNRNGMRILLAAAAFAITLPANAAASSHPQEQSDPATQGILYRRAVEAAIWGMPIVSVDAMREAFFRDAHAHYNDIVYWSRPADWMNQTTTPNSSTLYVYFNFNLKDGPVVFDLPPSNGAATFGSLLDAWQEPLIDVGTSGQDAGKGARYLLLPPGFSGEVPAGYIPVRSSTLNGYAMIRVIPKTLTGPDLASAVASIREQRVYPLAQDAHPPEQRHIDMAGKLFDGIVRYDETFYTRLARMVNEEPVASRDLVAMNQLRSVGIEKGRAFAPSAATQSILRAAVGEAHEEFIATIRDNRKLWWPGAHWGTGSQGVATKTGFTFQTADYLDVDERGAIYYLAYAPPVKLGKASFYLTEWHDASGQKLRGERTYRLRVPPNVPVRQFWAVTVYDVNSAGFIEHSPRVNLDSYDTDAQRNADGSIDLYFGSKPPSGKASNWIYTAPGKEWFAIFRFYGPEPAIFDRSWALGDPVRQ